MTASEPAPRGREDSPEQTAARLRDAILSGDYAPKQRLMELELSNQLDASRATVRIALQQLSFEGLVELQRNRGARVRSVTVEEAVQITEVRRVLEGLCAARAAERARPEDVARLRHTIVSMHRALERTELLAYSDLNAQLHGQIRVLAGNPTCARLVEQLRCQLVRHQFALAFQPGRAATSLLQHEAIVEAIGQGKPRKAEEAMHHHLDSVQKALRSIPRRPTSRDEPGRSTTRSLKHRSSSVLDLHSS